MATDKPLPETGSVPDAPSPTASAPSALASQAAPTGSGAARRWARRLAWFSGSTTLLLAALLVAGWLALLHHPLSLPWLLRQVPGLSVQGFQGTLGSGSFQAQSLIWQMPGNSGKISAQGLQLTEGRWAWRPEPGQWFSLHLSALSAERVQWRSGPPSVEPIKAPVSLRMPMALQIDALRIAHLQIDDQPELQTVTARVALASEHGALHRIDGLSGSWQQTQFTGAARIGSDAPLPVQLQLQAKRDSAPAWTAALRLAGPLDRLAADAQLHGVLATPSPGRPTPAGAKPPQAQARATLLPFAAWPVGDLTLSTAELDLSALMPDWPRTALSGTALVQSSGLDRPARIELALTNALPGDWVNRQLPLTALKLAASALPQQPEPLALSQIELTLGDSRGAAGVITGQGRWAAGELALDLQVRKLLPARLHSLAAAMTLSGPLQLQVAGLARATAAASLAPTVTLNTTLSGQALDASALPISLQLTGTGSRQLIQITQARLSAGPASAKGKAELRAVATGWQLNSQATLSRFDPRPWWRGDAGSAWRDGPHRLDGDLLLDLLLRQPVASPATQASQPELERWLSRLSGNASLEVHDSLVAGVPLAAAVQMHSPGGIVDIQGHIDLADNRISLQGLRAASPAADRWTLKVQAPALAKLAPLGRLAAEFDPALTKLWPSAGSLSGDLVLSGRWPALRSQGDLVAQRLSTPAASLQSAHIEWQTGDSADAPLAIKLQASGLAGPATTGPPASASSTWLDSLSATLQGSLRQHRLELRADSPAKPPTWTENLLGPAGAGTRLQASGQGSWTFGRASSPNNRWQLQGLQLQGGARDSTGGSRPWLAAQDLSAVLQVSPEGQPLDLTLTPGRVQLLSTALAWREASWQAATAGPGSLSLEAELERFDVAAMLARAQPTQGWGGDLTMGGRISVHSAARFDADIVLERLAGDLTLTDDLGATQALGVTDLRLALTAHDGLWQFAQGLAGRSLGEMGGAQVLRTSADKRWPPPNAPLQGVTEMRVANLGIWGAWVPPGWRLAGQLRTSASFGGTLGAPEVRGEMVGSGLGVRNLLQGVNVTGGELALTLSGDSARIDRFELKGGDGLLTLTGGATLGASPSARVHLAAQRFRWLGRIDRRLVASGNADLALDARLLKLDGSFTVDEGLIDLSQGDAPRLADDVQVHRATGSGPGVIDRQAAKPLPAPLRQAQVALKVNLGTGLRLRGHGLDTGLRGDLAVTSPDGRLALHGQVRAEAGTVAAYGQKLDIERGTVSFNGALDNPFLDVLAIRPNLDVRVGVMVNGPAQRPRIRLFSEPELADYDKLSWLVLGRSPDGLGRSDTALLQRAAIALLAGDEKSPSDAMLERIGLTDFSLRQSDGDTRETIVSLGKQLSRRWYLGYERSVNATTGTWQLIYRLAQRFTLRAQSGADNALDLIWSWRWGG